MSLVGEACEKATTEQVQPPPPSLLSPVLPSIQPPAAHRTRFIATVTLGIACALAHITLNLAMLLVFARSINALAEQTQILDAQRVGDLQRLAVKSMLYVSGNILLFIFLWFCFVVYPLNLRLAEVRAVAAGRRRL